MRLKEEFVTILIQPDSLLLFWFQNSLHKKSLFIPKAWKSKQLDSLQVNQSVIFNPTFLKSVIEDFLIVNNLKNAYIALGLSNTMIWEYCYISFKEQPTSDSFSNALPSLIWNYAHLGKNDFQENFFYLFGITREILFQYQLLALSVPFNCSTITSHNRALLYVMSFFEQPIFKTTGFPNTINQLSDHCMHVFDCFGHEEFFVDTSESFCDFFKKEKEAILASLGLFLLGKQYELQ